MIFNSSNAQKLFDAIEDQDIAKITNLIEKGEDVNMQKDNGVNPLFSASGKNNKEIVELLMNKGAKINPQDLLKQN